MEVRANLECAVDNRLLVRGEETPVALKSNSQTDANRLAGVLPGQEDCAMAGDTDSSEISGPRYGK